VFVSITCDEPAAEPTSDECQPVSYVERMLIDPCDYVRRGVAEAARSTASNES
jgi:hypothetical protein